jgi:hypothetical protein
LYCCDEKIIPGKIVEIPHISTESGDNVGPIKFELNFERLENTFSILARDF